MASKGWVDEIKKVIVEDPIFKEMGRDFIGKKVFRETSHPSRYIPVQVASNKNKFAFVIYGVPANFRKLFVQIFEEYVGQSFLYWDDSKATVDSVKTISRWLSGGQHNYFNLNVKDSESTFSHVIKILGDAGKYYVRVPSVSLPGEFSVKGDSIEIAMYGASTILRLEFFGDTLDSIKELDPMTRVSLRSVEKIVLPIPQDPDALTRTTNPHDRSYFNAINISSSKFDFVEDRVLVFADPGFNSDDLAVLQTVCYDLKYENIRHLEDLDISDLIKDLISKNNVKVISTEIGYLNDNLPDQIKENVEIVYGNLDKGLYFSKLKTVFLSDNELFGILHPDKFETNVNDHLESFLEDIKPGDYIVHEDHGIGLFDRIEEKEIQNEHGVKETKEYLILTYLENDTLFVPIEQKSRIIKYVGVDGNPPKLTRLDGKTWQTTKKAIQKKVSEIAQDLVDLYARRALSKGQMYEKDDESSEALFNSFAFDLTPDQEKSYQEIRNDMESSKVMDRLLVGDVGFGKTEIALRAAYKAVKSGKQVAVLAPTTVLVQQHLEVFKSRLEPLGIKVGGLFRVKTSQENKDTVERIQKGEIDVVVGTHRLLSKDVKFKRLSLLIVDEEQRFGVKQKEKIKKIKGNLDVLTMSATPIPRTLHMALSGIRDISIIQTPPPGRIPIKTSLAKFDWGVIVDAIKAEMDRGGQAYFVHNHVNTIYSIAEKLKELIPKARIGIGHGQMKSIDIAKVMQDFKSGEYDILVATTIIENGLDISTANTMVIDEAENFGLSELYQLRGRVGRSDEQAYCVLLYRGKTEEFADLIQGKKTNYEKELEKSLMSIELEESKLLENEKEMAREFSFGRRRNFASNKSFSRRLVESKEKRKNEKARKRLKAILESSELASGFALSAKDLEIRGAGNLLGKEQHGAVSKVGLGMYMRILGQAISAVRTHSVDDKLRQ